MIIHTDAVVLKCFPYSDTSIIARCFTRESGKVSLIIRGARRKNSSLAACFQPGNYLDIIYYFKSTRELQLVTKAEFLETWMNLREDLKKITYCLAVLELIDKSVSGSGPHPELLDVLVSVIRRFNNDESRLNIIFWFFEMKLLSIMGFKPDFTKQNFPGMVLPDPFEEPGSKEILISLRDRSLDSLPQITATPKERKIISEYLSMQLKYHFEGLKELNTFKVLKQLL